jgi:hypothetical protein
MCNFHYLLSLKLKINLKEHSQWNSQIFMQNDSSKLTLFTLSNEFLNV